jgi:hypothetical protein
MSDSAAVAAATTPTGTVDEKAVQSIANSEYFRFLGEDRIRKVAVAAEATGVSNLTNDGRWLNPSVRQGVLRLLGEDLPQISETYCWLVVRRYRELKRFYREQAQEAEKKKAEEEAKAKLVAEKAAKAAAAKAAAAAKPPAAAAATPASVTAAASADADKKP